MNKVRGLITLLAAMLIVTASFESGSRAASRLTEDFVELMRLSSAVVAVEVATVQPQPSSGDAIPVTYATLKVLKSYKGELTAESLITVTYIGGVQGDQRVIAPGQPVLAPGDRALVLLTKHKDNWRFVGGDAGHVIMLQDQQGNHIARRAAGVFEYFLSDAESLSGYSQTKAPAITAQRLEQLLSAIASTGRPVIEEPVKHAGRPAMVAQAPAIMGSLPADSGSSLASRILAMFAITTAGWLLLRVLNLRSRTQSA